MSSTPVTQKSSPIDTPTLEGAAAGSRGKKPRKDKSITAFRRALRYLGPHMGLVVTSIVCAFLVGLTFTSGLGAMLPVLRVLVSGDSVQNWANRQLIERRLDVRLADSLEEIKIVHAHHHGAAVAAGLSDDDQILLVGDAAAAAGPATDGNAYQSAAGKRASHTLAELANPDTGDARVAIVGGPRAGTTATVHLPELPWYLRVAHGVAARFPANPVAAVGVVLGFLVCLTVFGNFIRFFQEYYSDKAAILAVNDIRRELYDHVLHIPLGFFGLKGTSDVTSRLVQDAQGLQDGFKTVLGQSIQEPIKAAMAFGLALWFDWHLTLVIVLFGPVMFALIKKFGKKMRRASRKALQSSATMLGQLEGTLMGIRVVKGAVAERFERRRYCGIMGGLIAEQLRMSRIDAVSAPVLETLTVVVVCAIVLAAAYLVRIAHTLDATTFMGLMACLMAIGESLRRTSKVNNALQKANAAAVRIFETLDIPMERRVSLRNRGANESQSGGDGAPVNLPPVTRGITFENVTFTYPNAPGPALDGVSLEVPKGKCFAVVGRNGSGKTTLLSLLPRFYDPEGGRVLIDGLDIRKATLRSLRRQIGIVTQDAVIFPGTIADNIAYGQPLATRAQIIAAGKRAFAHDFILDKPGGYDALLGEHGLQLSGGQRQRLCIARAILRQTPILILDEATSQVDAESEHLIQQAIEGLIHERTTFVIAHRFSTILSADMIVVMDRGRIVGIGQHNELLAKCPVYQQLYDRQLMGISPAAREPALAAGD